MFKQELTLDLAQETHKLRKSNAKQSTQNNLETVEERETSNKDISFQAQPPGYKFIDSQRNVGYNIKYAIAELVDNSSDAEATAVHVCIKGKNIKEIVVMDNGFGMDYHTLQNSYKLGAERDRRPSERGKFGQGGTLGSLSFAAEKQTFTVDSEGEDFIGRGYSLEELKKQDGWGSSALGALPSEYYDKFTELYGEDSTGTIIIHKNLTLKNHNCISVRSQLNKFFGEMYFDFILNNKLQIFVDGKEVEASDPLKWDDPRVLQLLDEELEYKGKKFRLRVSDILPIYWAEGKKSCGFGGRSSVQSQGGYIVRSNRVIETALTNGAVIDGFWTRYPNNQGLRWQVNMDGEMDNEFGISAQKNSVDFEKDLLDIIRRKVVPFAVMSRKRYDSRKNKDSESDRKDTITRAEKALNSDYVRPKRSRKRTSVSKKKSLNASPASSKVKKTAAVPTRLPYVIIEKDMGRSNTACELKGDRVFINTEHPYIVKYYLGGSLETQNAVLVSELARLVTRAQIGEYNNEEINYAFDEFERTMDQKIIALVRQYS